MAEAANCGGGTLPRESQVDGILYNTHFTVYNDSKKELKVEIYGAITGYFASAYDTQIIRPGKFAVMDYGTGFSRAKYVWLTVPGKKTVCPENQPYPGDHFVFGNGSFARRTFRMFNPSNIPVTYSVTEGGYIYGEYQLSRGKIDKKNPKVWSSDTTLRISHIAGSGKPKVSYDLNLTTLHGVHTHDFVCFLHEGEFRFCVMSDFTNNLESIGQKVRRSRLNLTQPNICAVLSELAYEASLIYLSKQGLTEREICTAVMKKLPEQLKESIRLISFRHDKSDNAYIVAVDKRTRHLFIAFKGTSTMQNVVKDLCCAVTDPRQFQEFPCYVHSGIYRALEELLDGEDGIRNAAWLKNLGEFRCFNVTGHSLGGGMAALFLGWLYGQMNSGKIASIEIKGHSFAGPQVYATKDKRPGPRDAGAQKLWRFLNENLTTYIYGHDIVPRLPLVGNTQSLSDMINVNLRYKWNEIQKTAGSSSNFQGWSLSALSMLFGLSGSIPSGMVDAYRIAGIATVYGAAIILIDEIGARLSGIIVNIATHVAGGTVDKNLDWLEKQMRGCLNGDFQDFNKYHAVGRSIVYNPERDDYVMLTPKQAEKFFEMDHYTKSIDIHVTHLNLSCHSTKGYCSAFSNFDYVKSVSDQSLKAFYMYAQRHTLDEEVRETLTNAISNMTSSDRAKLFIAMDQSRWVDGITWISVIDVKKG